MIRVHLGGICDILNIRMGLSAAFLQDKLTHLHSWSRDMRGFWLVDLRLEAFSRETMVLGLQLLRKNQNEDEGWGVEWYEVLLA